MAFYLSKQYHSSPSLPQIEDESDLVTPAVSAHELDGGGGVGAGSGGANDADKSTVNSVYWSSGGDDMRYEASRVKSFGKDWPHEFLDPKILARAGFYYLSAMDLVQCPFCGLKLDGWGASHDPMKEHRRWQPRCPLVLDIPCGNVVSGYHVGSGSSGGRGDWHKMDLQMERSVKPSLPGKPPQLPAQQNVLPAISSSQFPSRTDWTRPRARSLAVPKEREKEMLAMLNASDKYISCRPAATSRESFANIWTPKPFSSKKASMFSSAVQSETYEKPKSFGHIVRAPDIMRVKMPASKITESDNLKRNQFKYASLHARLESYASWLSATKHMSYVLAEAGFYYSGIDDVTICFSCGGGLRTWVKGVDPWVEHARWYSGCSFLRMMKGDPYVTWVVRNKKPEVKPGNVRPYIVIPNIFEPDGKVTSSSQPSVTQREEHAIEQLGRNFYYMGYRRRGKFLIFKNDHFGSNVFLPNNGAYSDLKNLTNVFAQLNFEVYLYENLKYEEIISVLMNVAQEDHSNADCFGMAVFTRGEGNEILAAYDRQYFASDLYRIFSDNVCQSLSGKPKIFFFNVCESNERGLKSQSLIPNKIPLDPDFLLACTSWNGILSWNQPVDSSLQRLCEELSISGPKGDDLLSILRRIGYSDDKTSSPKNKFESSLRKKLCFLPKVW